VIDGMACVPSTRKRLRAETAEFTPESTALQSVMREIRLLREEQARREAEMTARERRRDEELQQLKAQLSRSNIMNLNDATARSLVAAESGDAFATGRGADTCASGDAHVTSRDGRDAGADACVELGFKLKPDTYDGSVSLREFFAQFDLIARASRWNAAAKTIVLASCLRARAVLESVENLANLDYEELKSKLELRFGEGQLSQDCYASFTSRRQKFGEDFASFGSDLERLCRLAYPEGTFALRDKIACSQFVSGIADSFVKKTLRLEGVNSLKVAIVRARAIKEIQEECYDRKGRKLNFVGKNLYEKKEQENGKAVGEKENVGGRKELRNTLGKNRVNVLNRKECWLCGKQGHFRFECPSKEENLG